MKDIRGKCKKCTARTRHKSSNDEWLCVFCEEEMKRDVGLDVELSKEDQKILSNVKNAGLSPRELQVLLKNPKPTGPKNKSYDHKTTGHVKIGIISDTHIGEKHFDEQLLKFAGETFRKEGIDKVYHCGDILEGMSGRDGHVYELAQIGFSQQINYAADIFKKYMHGFDIYGITGNHDQWYHKKNNGGIDVGEEFEERVPNFTYLGMNEADIKFAPNVTMKLFHANDGSAYATSYKLQKLIESLEGGQKPQILVEGHYHKAMYMFTRNVHGIEAGTLCGQSEWMRGKKIPAHKGFWILDFDITKKGIKKFAPTFYPAYD